MATMSETNPTEFNRQRFEQWITTPPYELDATRWGQDQTLYAWHGQYCHIDVQLAWEAWCEATNVPTSMK